MTQPAKQKKARIVLLLSVAGIAGWLGYKYWWGLHHVSSENAQIEGHIIPIAARVPGYVRAVPVSDNQLVKSGDLLVGIDDRDYSARARQGEAELLMALASAGNKGEQGQASAQVSVAQASASAANAQIAQAQANLERTRNDLDRIRSLAAKNVASQSQLDSAEAAYRSAVAQLKASQDSAQAATQQISASSAGLRLAKAKVESARAQRDLAQIALNDTRLVAPADGIISKKAVEVGQLVQAGQTLLYLVPKDDIWIVANLKETEVGRVKPGQNVEVEVDAYPGEAFHGTVESFSPATGAKFSLLPPDNATGNFTKVVQRVPVRIRLDAASVKRADLRPGMSVVVNIETR